MQNGPLALILVLSSFSQLTSAKTPELSSIGNLTEASDNLCPLARVQFGQLAALRVAEMRSWPLSAQDVTQLADLYAQCGVPILAIKLLNRAVDDRIILRDVQLHLLLSKLQFDARNERAGLGQLKKALDAGEENTLNYVSEYYQFLNPEDPTTLLNCDQHLPILGQVLKFGLSNEDDAWFLIGMCRYADADATPPPKTNCIHRMSDEEFSTIEPHPYVQKTRSASYAFDQVASNSPLSESAIKWSTFVDRNVRALRNRCRDRHGLPLCYQVIKQAYHAEVFTGEFSLEDRCQPYLKGFDEKHRAGE